MKLTTEFLIEHGACKDGIYWFENQDEEDVVKIVRKLIDEEFFNWAIWLIIKKLNVKQEIQYSLFAAKEALHIFELSSDDNSPRKAVEIIEEFLSDYKYKYTGIGSSINSQKIYKFVDDVYATGYVHKSRNFYNQGVLEDMINHINNETNVSMAAFTISLATRMLLNINYAKTVIDFCTESVIRAAISTFNNDQSMIIKILEYGVLLLNSNEEKEKTED